MAMTKEEAKIRSELTGELGDETFDQNYLVEAGAGAGKTYTMVKRILQHLISGKCEPEQMVAITFTKKATEEMRGRLDEALTDARDEEAGKPDRDEKRLARLEHLLRTSGQMQISTIHSFCQTMLAAMPFASPVGFDPQIGESESGACRAWLRNYWQTHPGCFHRERFRMSLSRDELERFFIARCGGKGARLVYTAKDAGGRDLEDLCKEDGKKLHKALRAALAQYDGELGIHLLQHSSAAMIRQDMRTLLAMDETAFAASPKEIDRLLRQIVWNKSKFPRTEDEAMSAAVLEIKEKRKAAEPYLFRTSHPLAAILPELDRIWSADGTTTVVQKQKQLKETLKKAGIDRTDAPDARLIHADLLPLLLMDADAFSRDESAQKSFTKLFNRSKERFRLHTDAGSEGKNLRSNAALSDGEYDQAKQAYEKWKKRCLEIPLAGILPAFDKIWTGAKSLHQNTRALLYSWLAEDTSALLEEYHRYKDKHRMAFSDDLLLLTRDMLRDSEEARSYFHRRYRSIYVDEFQDTDLVQTQLLFYLTAETFDIDWKKCVPAKGSLFLVGDPKQAIYRFRGADINTYKAVYQRFAELESLSQGKRVSLGTSFRASQEICDCVNTIFAGLMDGQGYQAGYAPMGSQSGPANRPDAACSAAIQYQCLSDTEDVSDEDISRADALMLADFIKALVDGGVTRTVKGKTGPYRYGDFLILTHKTFPVNIYMSVLAEQGIPVNVTGKYIFRDFQPLARLQLYLEWLLTPSDGQTLTKLLKVCYGADLTTLHRFCQYANIRYLNQMPEQDLEALRAVFSAELERTADNDGKRQMERLLALCGSLAELKLLQNMTRSAPALSVIQRILEGCSGLWTENEPLQRRRECSFVLQYLAKLRSAQQHSFPAMARFAIDCLEEEAKQEVSLESQTDCVRVMNLHQAKGLEAPVVMLAYSRGSFRAADYLIEEEKGENVVYAALQRPAREKKPSTLACPIAWQEKSKEEEKARKAEELRLIYVAATRAAQLLCVNLTSGGGFWSILETGSHSVDELLQDKAWSGYAQALRCLVPQTLGASAVSAAQKGASAVVTVSGMDCERELDAEVQELSATSLFAITPSKLEHGTHALTRKERVEDAEDDNRKDDEPTLDKTPPPKGKEWGTIVHSVMEQAVRHRDYSPEALARYARQAACNVLLDAPLTPRERSMLVGEEQPESLIDFVAEKAARAAAFFRDEKCQLRQMIAGADCYPEMPFYLRVKSSGESTLYRHLKAHIPENQGQKDIDVQGVIDLAVRSGDGDWIVVDYKTDSVREGETWEVFSGRLREEYTAQIASYAQVLEQMGGKVKRAVLCSIPCGGRLIELPLGDASGGNVSTPAPDAQTSKADAQIPAPAASVFCHGAGELYSKGHFSAALNTSQGAHGFSLLVDGIPVSLTDNRGNTAVSHKMCRRFAEGVSRYLCARYPGQDCSVDFTNAGTKVILTRMLKMMKRVLPEEVWETIQLSWENGES